MVTLPQLVSVVSFRSSWKTGHSGVRGDSTGVYLFIQINYFNFVCVTKEVFFLN